MRATIILVVMALLTAACGGSPPVASPSPPMTDQPAAPTDAPTEPPTPLPPTPALEPTASPTATPSAEAVLTIFSGEGGPDGTYRGTTDELACSEDASDPGIYHVLLDDGETDLDIKLDIRDMDAARSTGTDDFRIDFGVGHYIPGYVQESKLFLDPRSDNEAPTGGAGTGELLVSESEDGLNIELHGELWFGVTLDVSITCRATA